MPIKGWAQPVESFEFVNQDLKDIVYIMSLRSGKTIVCDDTVSGIGSFMYAAGEKEADDFESVFDAFLKSNRLTVTKEDNIWIVTRIRVINEEKGSISVNAYDSSFSSIFEKISEKTGKSIIYEILPSQRISLNIQNQSVINTVKLMLQPYSEYSVEETGAGVQIVRRKNTNPSERINDSEEKVLSITEKNGLYTVQIKNTGITQVLDNIFTFTDSSYSNFLQEDYKINSLSFTDKTLGESLTALLEQVNAEAFIQKDMWYIFAKPERTVKDSVLDKERSWHTIGIKGAYAQKAISTALQKEKGVTLTELSGSLLAVFATEEEYSRVKSFLEETEKSLVRETIELKYISTKELLEHLPPYISKEEISDTGTGSSFFYIGNIEKKEMLLAELKEIDRPKKLVRYDLLILQYEKSASLSWGISSSAKPSVMGDRTLISGEIGSLLNINFDAITAFGLTFCEKINTAMTNNEASVFADTTLYGLSGEKLSFRNTNTYRYKDASIDPSTGKESFSTVTREITSGLVLEIDGWVSGDDTITMQITTSVSKQGVDVSKKNGNPPPTSEKNITTKIRARSGEAVVLSGLSQSDFEESSQGVPFLSKIPVIGTLFKGFDSSNSKTEMTIYLLPHIEEDDTDKKSRNWKEQLLEYVKEKKEKACEGKPL